MASIALDWAIANGLGQAEFDARISSALADAKTAGLSDATIGIEMNRLGISAADVTRATGANATQYVSAVPTTGAELIAAAAAATELAARTAQDKTASPALIAARNLAATTAIGKLTSTQVTTANTETQNLVTTQTNAANLLAQNNAAYAEQQRLNNLAYAEQQRLNKIKSDQQIAANQKAYEAYLANQAKLNPAPTGATSVTGTMPFAGATQGFEQNFRNYTSIPIGAQYNPNVVGGTGSPYSQVMGQMQPVGNPYAGVVAGQAMGGYNPALYDQIATVNAANTAAAAAAAAATQLDSSSTGGDGNSTAAGEGPGGNSGGGEGNGATAGEAGAGYAMGGMVNGLFGMNPPGPDDGAGYLDRGEYVVKKSAVNKYGRGLLDMINEGKVPAKKLKSLLG